MSLIDKTVARIREEFSKQGNGAIIHHKNGKDYALYFQQTGCYHITDQVSIWEPETFRSTVPTIEELAEVIINL